jgi:uncharacterized membrane protein YbhN (UPF0104 family)
VASPTLHQRARAIAAVAGAAVAAYLVAKLFAHADASAIWKALGSHPLLAALAPAPFVLGMAMDAYGTVTLLRALGSRTTFMQMLPVRIASEALHLGVPAGFVASDTATAVLLETRSDVPLRDGVVASIARRWLTMRAHGIYIAIGVLVGYPTLTALSQGAMGGKLPWLVLALAALPIGASWVLGASLLGRSTFAKIHQALTLLPVARLRRWLEARRGEAMATDAQVARLRAARRATVTATGAFLACWCIEALESAFLLRLVGGSLGLGPVFAIEGGVSLVRSLAVAVPSGLGVVDFGYATVFSALGMDSGCAAAFVLLKRSKELAWVMAGYALLGGMRERISDLRPSFVEE